MDRFGGLTKFARGFQKELESGTCDMALDYLNLEYTAFKQVEYADRLIDKDREGGSDKTVKVCTGATMAPNVTSLPWGPGKVNAL